MPARPRRTPSTARRRAIRRRSAPRRLRLARLLLHRRRIRIRTAVLRHAVRVEVWAYVAAGSLIGFEGLELLFGSFLLAPEFLPVALLAIALLWALRRGGHRVVRLLRLLRLRRRRARRRRRGHADAAGSVPRR